MFDIYSGIICNGDKAPFKGEVIVSRGRIWGVQQAGMSRIQPNKDYGDCLIFPGMIDVHTHAREDHTGKQMHKEEYLTACDAALNGGVVAIGTMGNTPEPTTTSERYLWHQQRLSLLKHRVRVFHYAMLTNGSKPFTHPAAYKAMLCESVGNAYLKDRAEMEHTLPAYAEPIYSNLPVSFHVEDQHINEMSKNAATHNLRRPRRSVTTSLRYLLPIIEDHNINAKLCHWSTGGESFDLIGEHRERMAAAKKRYTSLEVSPLHLLFDADMLQKNPELWPYVQMNPSIQNEHDRLQLIEGLRNGFIDHLATDHAPHTLEEKFQNFARFKDKYTNASNEEIHHAMLLNEPELCKAVSCENGVSGAPWLDTYALVTTYLMKEHGFTPQDIARVTGFNPGKFVNDLLDAPAPITFDSQGRVEYRIKPFFPGFGKIEKFYAANFTIIDMHRQKTFTRADVRSKCGWSPLENWTFPGSIRQVVVNGEEII